MKYAVTFILVVGIVYVSHLAGRNSPQEDRDNNVIPLFRNKEHR